MNPGLSAIILFKLQIKYLIWQEQRHSAGLTESKQAAEQISNVLACDMSKVFSRASFASHMAYFTEGFVTFVSSNIALLGEIIGIFLSHIKHSLPVTNLKPLLFQIWPFQICHAVSAC